MDKWINNHLIELKNIVGKGEIAHYEQFLLFPQCFQKQSVVYVLKQYLWSKGLILLQDSSLLFPSDIAKLKVAMCLSAPVT